MLPHPITIGLAQWLPEVGNPDANLEAALEFVGQASERGVDVLVLSELWLSGYDANRLATDVAEAAEEVPGSRLSQLQNAAREHQLWIVAGSIPEATPQGVFNTAVVFDRAGAIRATHRKQHLYQPTGEDLVFQAGSSVTTFDDEELGTVGITVCFDGDFPQTAAALRAKGADVVFQVNAYEFEAEAYWDRYYPGAAISHGQWWIMCNQCGTNDGGTLLGASRVIAPTGDVVAEAQRAVPGSTPAPELLIATIEESPATQEARDFAALLS